jgi:hypothetical protein
MTRKNPGAGTSSREVIEFWPPVSKGAAYPLKYPGFRPLYLPFGSVCVVERPDRTQSPDRILVLDRSISPFLPSREFRELQKRLRKWTKAGSTIRWIAFYPGRKSPQYVFLPIPPQMAEGKYFIFLRHPRKRGRPRETDYEVIRQYQRAHPQSSHQMIASRLGLRRATVTRALSAEDRSDADLLDEDPFE